MLYPITTETRNVFDLGGIWKFKLDQGKGFKEKWYQSILKDPLYMPVPSSYNEVGVIKEINNHIGWVWYETEVVIPNHYEEERMVLRFGSATHFAKVYINGNFIGDHKGGFLPFEFEINDYVKKGKNRLTVAVNNILDLTTLPVGIYKEESVAGIGKVVQNSPNFDFFNYAGLQRPIKIYTTPTNYVKDIAIDTNILDTTGRLDYNISIIGKNDFVHIKILDEMDNIVATGESINGSIEIVSVNLWEPLNAYLYTFRVELVQNGRIVDIYEEPFGFRTIEVKDGEFLINNKPFYFKGFGKHEDSPIHGRGFSEAANVLDFNLMKWVGANSFRTAHYPYSEELMRLADREGFVVIDETPAVGLHLGFMATAENIKDGHTWKNLKTFDHHKEVIKKLIERDKNHPSVVMWSIANEPASEEEGALEYFKPLVDLAKSIDVQKRPVTIATFVGSSPEKDKIAEIIDVLALNRYFGWYEYSGNLEIAKVKLREELESWHKRCPNKPIIMAEYGADTIMGIHEVSSTMFSEEFQAEFLQTYHEVFDEFNNFVGEHVWNFADFSTSENIRRVNGNKKGIFSRDRKPKYAAHKLRERWLEIPNFQYKK